MSTVKGAFSLHSCWVLESSLLLSILLHCWFSSILLGWSDAELLSLMIAAEALRVLIQSGEASALLLVRSYSLHFNNLGSRQDIVELNWRSVVLLVLDDLLDIFFNR